MALQKGMLLDPMDPSLHVFKGQYYGLKGRKEEQLEVRRNMIDKYIVKVPGKSVLILDGKVGCFHI